MINYTFDFSAIDNYTKALAEGQLPFAVSHCANKSLTAARKAVVDGMAEGIEGGATRWTKQGMRILYTSKGKLQGGIAFKRDRSYMKEVIYGGSKGPKPSSSSIPHPMTGDRGAAKLNKYGNFPRNYLEKAMSQAQTNWSSVGTRKTYRGINGFELRKLQSGKNAGSQALWQWKGKGKQRAPHLIAVFVKGRKQRQIYDAPAEAYTGFTNHFRKQFAASLNMALRNAR